MFGAQLMLVSLAWGITAIIVGILVYSVRVQKYGERAGSMPPPDWVVQLMMTAMMGAAAGLVIALLEFLFSMR